MLRLIVGLAAVTVPPAAPNTAQVVFYRSGTLFGGAISCAVHENGAKLTSLPPGHYAIEKITPGAHDFTVSSEATDTYKVDAHPGETYYAKCTVGVGIMAGHPHLTSSSQGDFDLMSGKLKPAKGSDTASKDDRS